MNIISGFPGVITLRVSLPFDQVLQGMATPKVPMISDHFNFVFFLPFDKIQQQLGEVWSMLHCFMIG
jgi:hypothetical protein